jgi:PAS domain S-box-containing protein
MTVLSAPLQTQAALLDALDDAIVVVDLDDHVVFVNAAARALFGYRAGELRGTHVETLIPERLRAAPATGGRLRGLAGRRQRALDTRFELTARQRDGRELPVEATLGWADLDGATFAVFKVRKIAERERAEAVQRLAAVVASSPDAILTKDLDGIITTWNRGAERIYGYSAAEAIGQPVSMLVDPQHVDELDQIMAQIKRGQAVEALETVRVGKDGRAREMSVSVSPLRGPDGAVVGAATVARDLSARKRADERVRALLESAPDAVVVINEHGRIVFVNRKTEALFGQPREALLGETVQVLMPEWRDRPAYLDFLHGTQPGGTAFERVAQRADGTEFPTEVTFSPLRTEDGLLVFASIRDITGRKAIEEELRRSNHDLEQFAYVASHDLSEPLRVIAGFVDLLARRYRGRLDEDADRFIGFTVAGVERMQALIDDLLAYSRAGRVAIEAREVDTAAIVRDVLWGLEPQISERGVVVEVGDLPTVRAEKALLRQIFANLISNAIKFSDSEQPVVRIGAARQRDGWRFDIEDNGPGVDPRYADRVFEMFQRLHGRDVPGSGMGLAIVKRLAERHGGRAWVSPAQPRGSVFHFTLSDRAGDP